MKEVVDTTNGNLFRESTLLNDALARLTGVVLRHGFIETYRKEQPYGSSHIHQLIRAIMTTPEGQSISVSLSPTQTKRMGLPIQQLTCIIQDENSADGKFLRKAEVTHEKWRLGTLSREKQKTYFTKETAPESAPKFTSNQPEFGSQEIAEFVRDIDQAQFDPLATQQAFQVAIAQHQWNPHIRSVRWNNIPFNILPQTASIKAIS